MNEMRLEKKGSNTHIKKAFLKSTNAQRDFLKKRKEECNKLQFALETALEWQEGIENTVVTKNGYNYVGPHKWIVCLIGSSSYSITMLLHDQK